MNDLAFNRRDLLKTMGIGALSFAAPGIAEAAESKSRKPNIVFILADDLGYGDVGCFGQTQIKTPRLDRMAANGMRLTQHYAGCTVCAPSRATLMTGYHTGHLRIKGQGQSLLPEELTVPEMLKRQAGYATGAVGKWGLGREDSDGVPNKKGFDFYYGYLDQRHAHNYWPEFLWRNQEKETLRNVVKSSGKGPNDLGGAATECVDYSHDLFTREALAFMDRNKDKPFFLYLPFTIPHANNEAQGVLNRHGMEVPDYGEYTDKDWPDPQKGHAAMISRLDRDVGVLLDRLESLGLANDTFVMFSSDNGPHMEGGAIPEFHKSSGPLRGIKRDLYEGGIRVPTIAYWPGKIAPGTVCDLPSAFWDLMPTCAELVGVDAPEGIDGVSLAPTLLGHPERQRERELLYWEFSSKQAIRLGDWKAVRLKFTGDKPSPIELYNLKDDIGETRDVARQHPELVARFAELFKSERVEYPTRKSSGRQS